MLADHERDTGEQVVVVTLDSLQGYTIEDYGYQLGRHWGIGQKGIEQRRDAYRRAQGAQSSHRGRLRPRRNTYRRHQRTIIQNYILPSFKRGDFNAGILAGTTSILQVLGGNPFDQRTESSSSPQPLTVLAGSVSEIVII